jgi:hypothetical protein
MTNPEAPAFTPTAAVGKSNIHHVEISSVSTVAFV